MSDEYARFSIGIKAIQSHIFDGGMNGENVCAYASEIMYLATSLLTGQKEYERITNPEMYRNVKIPIKGIKTISSIRNINHLAYAYMIKSFLMLQEIGLYTESI